jgi:hypothetical protein
MHRIEKTLLIVFLGAGLAWAGNPWKDKPYQNWSMDEVKQVLNHSPWVRLLVLKPSGKSKKGEAFEIRWVSSRTVREGLVQQRVLAGTLKQGDADAYVDQEVPGYQLAVFRADLAGFSDEEVRDMTQSALLTMGKSKKKAKPSQVSPERTPDGKTVALIFTFPRALPAGGPTIGPEEDSVEFSCRTKASVLATDFDPKEMVDAKGRDL